MNALPAEQVKISVEEYLAGESESEIKHEYFQGEVFAMAGGTRAHNLITGNLIRTVGTALMRRPCEVYPSDMRVKSSLTELYTYPDVSIVCGKPLFENDKQDTLLNPRVVVEVLSDSTENYDRGKKFVHYRSIESVTD